MKISYPLQGENFRLSHPLGAFGIRKGTPHKGVDLYANNGTPWACKKECSPMMPKPTDRSRKAE